MKSFLVFVAIIVSVTAITEEQIEQMKVIAKKCIESSGVDKKVLNKARIGHIQDDIDPKFKDFIFCTSINLQFISETGEIVFNKEKTKQLLPENFTDEEKERVISTCNQKRGSTPRDTSFAIYKCYRENIPSSDYITAV